MIKNEFYKLTNGVKIPKIGFGTWQSKDGDEAYNSCIYALKAGYRHIDTAFAYGNELSVGKAIIDSKINRNELFIVTKLPADIKTYSGTIEYFEKSLNNLGLDYLDLYLIHAPWPWSDVGGDYTSGNLECWKAMIDLYNQGKIKAIGVSNFHPKDMDALIEATNFVPHVNQMRFFIGNTQNEIYSYCKEHNILIEAYSPLGTGKLLDHPTLEEMANKYGVSKARLCIRYCIEKGTLPLPKSVHEERVIDNLKVDFDISKEDIEVLDKVTIDESLKRKLRS